MRGRGPGPPGRARSPALSPQPWWFGPPTLPPADHRAPFDLVLLDRDGTLNVRVEGGYVTRPEQLELLPGAAEALGAVTAAGCRAVVVTNQRGLARELMTPADLEAVHRRLGEALAVAGGRLDAIVVCPHGRDSCDCRKPAAGLFREVLARAPWARAERCLMVGDMPTDLEPARRLGMGTLHVDAHTGFGALGRAVSATGPAPKESLERGRGQGHVP